MEDDAPKVAIIGLGYVGLTLGVALARRGVMVYGIEKRAEVVEMTNAGQPHFAEVGLENALQSVVAGGSFAASETTAGLPPCEYYVITGTQSPFAPAAKFLKNDARPLGSIHKVALTLAFNDLVANEFRAIEHDEVTRTSDRDQAGRRECGVVGFVPGARQIRRRFRLVENGHRQVEP